uniref:ATP synthase subunit a n=1 Tax=Podarcis siculus TaxID=65484 RepID=A0A5P8PAI4_PODSI|nr:ATP synthase F0 subunit 6 [Podarcis siculus]QFR52719.1 ATP synthase F0 subunit 6 [Podarcis siculus]QFR52732.1 ATP synthase F0 subunit 6 [Podarcis siculus]QFR52745.1 ATP synthase F0 subunit 6 [Podarcis siculus]QFR52758.1 ATP synthase F0 subunit 6 [Podarcis siculus]
MTLSFFDQFAIPNMLGIPLIIPALFFPLIIWFSTNRLIQNRYSTIQSSLIISATKQMMLPINITGHKWASTLMALLLMLTLFNTLGLLPYTFTPTTQLSMNMALAIPTWLMTVLIGLRNQPTASLGHLLPEGTPTLLIPMLVMIETVSLFIRPIALGVRLTANLTAGHLLIQLTSTAVLALMSTMTLTASMTLIILILLTCLEMAVALIQAYVFVLLLTLYLQENI